VPGDWKIVYTCAGQNIAGTEVDGALIVSVYGSDNSIIDPTAVNATCNYARTFENTLEQQKWEAHFMLPTKGDPERARTSGLQFRKLSLYPLSYGIMHWLVEQLYWILLLSIT
jgi:hypothetical protein